MFDDRLCDSWAPHYRGIAALYAMMADMIGKLLSETVLGASLEIGFREFGVSVDRDGVCVNGMFWTWDEWLAQGDLPPNWGGR